MNPFACSSLTDADLLREVHRLTGCERTATARLIAALGELDARRLFLAEGCASLFTYCTQVLHLSEHAAYGRIEAARAARKWPVVLERLADGSLHLTAVMLLGRHLTTENHEALLAAARHRSKREIEELVASLRPQPSVPTLVRKLPAPTAGSAADRTPAPVGSLVPREATCGVAGPAAMTLPPARRAAVAPLAPEQYKVQFTVSRETYEHLRQVQDLLRHRIPHVDAAIVFERGLNLLLAELRKAKHGAVARPCTAPRRPVRGRHVPAAVKRTVWERDGGQCAFVGTAGRCTERACLEYHHLVPFADGGATTIDNLALRCRAHNGYEAERWSGTTGESKIVVCRSLRKAKSCPDASTTPR